MRWTERQLAMLREMGVHVVVPARADVALETTAPTPAASLAATASAVEAPATVAIAPPPPTAPIADGAPAVRADWLVLADLDDASSDGDETRLLANLLRAIGVSEGDETAPPARRAVRLDPRRLDVAAVAVAVERADARAVLAFGKAAAKAVLGGDEPVGRLRGVAHRGPHGSAVVVSWPPSYLLRQPDEKAKAWADLCLAVATVEAAA